MKHDVMKALAAARPERLDPPADPAAARERRERDLGRVFQEDREPVRSAGRRRPVRWTVFGAGALAAGAAAAVAITAVGAGSPAPSSPGASVDLGKQAVLAAAEQAAAQPTGKYWYSHKIHGLTYIVRPASGSYAIVGAHTELFRWTGAEPGAGEAVYGREIPARPLTPRDEKLWRKAGSPSTFKVWSNDHYATYGRGATKWKADPPDAAGGGEFFVSGSGRSLTTEQIQKLPSDPERLAALFLDPVRDPVTRKRQMMKKLGVKDDLPPDPGACGSAATSVSRAKVDRAETLLMDAPLPPKVRSGLMRALAGQPGVESIGETTDVLGRAGVALASAGYTACRTDEHGPASERGRYGSRDVLIFDRETGRPLASQQVLTEPGGPYRDREPGFVISYRVVRDLGWTDDKPEPPAKLPF
ncbi:CU044_5270 family protein [Actinomadura welshii]